MLERFEGEEGHIKLEELLRRQRLLFSIPEAASRLARSGQLQQFNAGEVVIHQEAGDDCVYFLLSGEAEVRVNGRSIAVRTEGEAVGEMAALDAAAPRSATVVARTKLIALSVRASVLIEVGNEFPNIWRNEAKVLSERLRQRKQFHRAPSELPLVFVGSSVEGLAVAEQLQVNLQHAPFKVKIWTNAVFAPSSPPLDDLLRQLELADFAVFVMSPDDEISGRSTTMPGPRDNVVFELGLFIGRLGRERVFMLRERRTNLKVPTDLLGISPLFYSGATSQDLAMILGPAATELKAIVKRMGPA